MQRQSHHDREFEPGGRYIVHVASRVTEEVFSFLGPATAALQDDRLTALLIALDDASTRCWLERFDPTVVQELVPTGRGQLMDLVSLRTRIVETLSRCRGVEGIHFHGVIPCLLGHQAVRALGIRVPVFFSPHASRLLGRSSLGRRAMMSIAGLRGRGELQRPIASHRVDVQRMSGFVDSQISLIESPVLRTFFDLQRHEDGRPVIVGGGRSPDDDDAIDMFTQLAVLLTDTVPVPEFHWIGQVSDTQREWLDSVKARVLPPDDALSRARLLARTWIYLAPPGGRGVPVRLAEAMAAGVPCVAADTPFHREVVSDRVSGFLYASQEEALQAMAALLDSPSLRKACGSAAREEALRRFDDQTFRQRLLQAYGQPVEAPEPAAAVAAVAASAPAAAAEAPEATAPAGPTGEPGLPNAAQPEAPGSAQPGAANEWREAQGPGAVTSARWP